MKTNLKNIALLVLIFLSKFSLAQFAYADWDEKYTYKPAEDIIKSELEYAAKVEKDSTEGQYYFALEKYRFIAEFTGNQRKIDPDVLKSMKRVIAFRVGNSDALDNLVENELEFNIGNSTIWMPIQEPLLADFLEETSAVKKVLLYALFSNEHTGPGKIYNIFFISEFACNWD